MATDQSVLHFPVNALINKSLHIFEKFGDGYEIQGNQNNGLSNKIKVICTDDKIIDFAECKLHFDETNNPYYQITIGIITANFSGLFVTLLRSLWMNV